MAIKYMKLQDGNPIEYSIYRLRNDNPNTSFPRVLSKELLSEFGVYEVIVSDKPNITEYQTATLNSTPELIDDAWYLDWTITDMSNEEVLLKLKELGESTINSIIQSKVQEYNTAHNLTFKDIYSCANYRLMDGYTHQQFCQDIWAWNVAVWESARATLEEIVLGNIEIPTIEEFIATLPEYTGVE